jgi:hypothetical protein
MVSHLECLVSIGRPVWLYQSWNDLNLETLRVMGCDSVVGSWSASGLEFAIYSNESIHGIQDHAVLPAPVYGPSSIPSSIADGEDELGMATIIIAMFTLTQPD